MKLRLSHLPSRRLSLALLSFLLAFPFLFGFLRQRFYGRQPDFTYRAANNRHPPIDTVSAISQNTFEHSDFFHTPRETGIKDHCDAVTQTQIADIVQSLERPINASIPLAFHFQNGSPIAVGHDTFSVGSGFCSVIIAPQVPWKKISKHQNLPVEGLGPDQIHAEIGSPDVRLELTSHPEYWGTLRAKSGLFKPEVRLAVYGASYSLYHPGPYQIEAQIEYQNYDWAMEDPIDFRFVEHNYQMGEVEVQPRSPPITVTGMPVSRPTQPCYRRGADDVRGRWYRTAAFNDYGNQTALNRHASPSFVAQAGTRDGWGWSFAPDACTLDYFTPKDHLSCFRNKTMHVVGDSNSRRVLKSLVGGGESWCPGEDLTDMKCQCQDFLQDEDLIDASGHAFSLAALQKQADHKNEPMMWGYGSKVFFDMVGGIVNPVIFNGWSLYYSGRRYMNDTSSEDQLSIAAQRQIDHGPADVVYVSMVTWDVAALRTPAETLAFLPEFREKFFATYRKGTRFVFRLANGVCCGNNHARTRYSNPRFMMWNTLWRQFFAEDVKAGKVMFIDGSSLQGRRETEVDIRCATSHLRVSHVRMEQQMFMNAVCEKTVNGTARMRHWWK